MATKEKLKILKNVSKRSLFKNKIPGGIFIQLKPEMLTKILTKKSVGGEMLKPVNKEKNPGLAKLPEKVRNRMGYAKKGKMLKANSGRMAMIKQLRGKDLGPAAEEKLMKMPIQDLREKVKEKKMTKANKGMSVKGDDKRDIRKTESMIGASKSSKREKGKKLGQVAGKAIKASMGKSIRGYGAARTSGMGLQDEQLVPGKSLDYYKDLM